MTLKVGISAPVFSTMPPAEIAESIFQYFTHWEVIAEGTLDLSAAGDTIKEKADEFGASLSIHLPMSDVNIAALRTDARELSIAAMEEQMRLGSDIGAEVFTIHPGSLSPLAFHMRKEAYNRNITSLSRLTSTASDLGVKLALENMPMPHWFLGWSQQGFSNMLGELPDIWWCFDIGHAHAVGELESFLDKGPFERLANIHIHDNMGSADDHLPLGEGTVPLKEVIERVLPLSKTRQVIIESRDLQEGIVSLRALEDLLSTL